VRTHVAHVAAAAEEDAAEVDVDVFTERLEFDVAQGRDRGQHPRIVDPQVDRPEALDHFIGKALHPGFIANIDDSRDDVVAPWQHRGAARAQAQAHAVAGKTLCQPSPDPTARAGDDRGSTFQLGR